MLPRSPGPREPGSAARTGYSSLSQPQLPPPTQEEDAPIRQLIRSALGEKLFGEWTRRWRWAAGTRTEDGAATQLRGPRPRPLTSPHSRRDSSRRRRRRRCSRCSRSDRQARRVTGSAGRGRGREVTAATRGRWLRTSASSRRRRAGPPRPPTRTRRPPSWPSRRARLLASRMTRVSEHLPPARWPLRSRDSRAGVSQRSGLERGR